MMRTRRQARPDRASARFRKQRCIGKNLQQRRRVMPEVVVYMLEGRSLEQKRGLIKTLPPQS
jgi:hypothetical protein